ncbi:hypothetical protein LLH00_11515 [bacterium]|nr:hypothetical protein [bacterium]
MIVEHSYSRRCWQAAESGSLAVRMWRWSVRLPGQIARGSRLLCFLRRHLWVEDHLAQDRAPLIALMNGSKGIELLVNAARSLSGRVFRLAQGDIRAFRNSRLHRLLAGENGLPAHLPAARFFVLFLVLFSLMRFASSALGPGISALAPWTAGPSVGALAAVLIAVHQGGFRRRGGLIWTIGATFSWCRRVVCSLLKRARRILCRVVFERGNPPVEGGPGE